MRVDGKLLRSRLIFALIWSNRLGRIWNRKIRLKVKARRIVCWKFVMKRRVRMKKRVRWRVSARDLVGKTLVLKEGLATQLTWVKASGLRSTEAIV